MISSRALQHRITDRLLSWDTGLSTHTWQAIDIARGTPTHYRQWVPPEAYPTPGDPDADLAAAARRACTQYAHEWEGALRRKDVDLMWTAISRAPITCTWGWLGCR